MNTKAIKKLIKYLSLLALALLLLIIFSNIWIVRSTHKLIFDDITEIPTNDVAVVLGTSRYSTSGYTNLFFKYRMEAAAKLYHHGKVKHILVSGDNRKTSYNEPRDMKEYLIELGVPAHHITLDYAGFRTLDSVVRAKEVFRQQSFTLVSQEFHNQRALFICNYYGIDAVAFNAQDVSANYQFRITLREYLAKFKAVLDLYIIKKEPRFLGEEEVIEV